MIDFIENYYHDTSLEKQDGYDEEMAKRKSETTLKIKTNLTGYLKKYAKLVSSADKGAIIE